jgi:hypothetical protein
MCCQLNRLEQNIWKHNEIRWLDIKFICKVISDGPHFRYLKARLYTLSSWLMKKWQSIIPTKNKTKSLIFTTKSDWNGGHRSRDRMVVGFTTTYAISAYNHCCCEFESRSRRGVKHYLIKFVSDLRQVGGFLRVLRIPPPIKLTAAI